MPRTYRTNADPGDEGHNLSAEEVALRNWRFEAAVAAGLRFAEAELFSASRADIETLRRLAALRVEPGLIARIVL